MPFAKQPERLRTQLLPFQLQGLHWMCEREREGDGGLLCDDMGLGKTLQVLGLICARPAVQSLFRQTLIVVPMSCLEQWHQELLLHAPLLTVLKYYGPGAMKKSLSSLACFDVLLTTYGVVQSRVTVKDTEKDKLRKMDEPLRLIKFHRIVLDEVNAAFLLAIID